jgi:hypothetical protein
MNNLDQATLDDLADTLALRIQDLRTQGLLKETETLLNLDYTSQAAQAPFLFDMARGILHRNHCTAIPPGSGSTLYAVWELTDGDKELACAICRPESGEQSQLDTEGTSDILFGIVSFLDQFSAVLRERGKEYRNANTGSALVAQVEKLTACFDQTDWASLIPEPPQNVPTEHIAFASEKRQPATAFPRQRSRRPGRRPRSEEPLSAVYL